MPTIICPACQTKMKAPDKLVGCVVKCVSCMQACVVGDPQESLSILLGGTSEADKIVFLGILAEQPRKENQEDLIASILAGPSKTDQEVVRGFLEAESSKVAPKRRQSTRRCPFCAKKVLKRATQCRHCLMQLDQPTQAAKTPEPPDQPTPAAKIPEPPPRSPCGSCGSTGKVRVVTKVQKQRPCSFCRITMALDAFGLHSSLPYCPKCLNTRTETYEEVVVGEKVCDRCGGRGSLNN
jgi:hypothetical protein